jgi:glycosyltransferase involved in cell wall biosynthesis
MPFAVLEAMGTGLAVVSTDVGDVRHMVAAENQPYVTALGDDSSYQRALAAIAGSPTRRIELGRLNRSRCVDRYDMGTMVDAYRELYSQVIGR